MLLSHPFIFTAGFRLSSVPAVFSGIFATLAVYFWTGEPRLSLVAGFISGLWIFLACYASGLLFIRQRLYSLQKKIGDAFPEKYKPEKDPALLRGDELDQVLNQAGQLHRAIQKELRRMDETENYRKEFIGDISHELKTPIFTIQSYLETLSGGAVEDVEVNYKFLHKALKNVNRLIYLTEDLMEISRLETGELKPEAQIFPLNNLIRDVMDSLQHLASRHQVYLHFDEKETNIFAFTDRHQIRQVLINLIENAIKYNKTGGSVHISTRVFRDNPEKIQVSIRDSGIGIEKEFIGRVTERFFRVDKSRSRDQGGTGLGLSIVKHTLELNKEKLWIESVPGEGSTFSFTVHNADYREGLDSSPP